MLTGNIGIHFDHDRGILLWQVECRRIMTGEFAGTAKPAVIELWPMVRVAGNSGYYGAPGRNGYLLKGSPGAA
jgi:hypothetical protein